MTTGPEPVPGVTVVDKPAGWTSHQVVGRVRRLLGTRRIGHAGTLDPMATGVLVLGIGKATRLLGHLSITDKAYEATIRLGEVTVTDDAEGEVTHRAGAAGLSDAAIEQAMDALRGQIGQVPSSVSAIKVNGVRSYARVRSGEEVTLPARPVTVSRFELLARRDLETDARQTVGPEPVGPEPVGPEPVGPGPVGPEPVGPGPVGPDGVRLTVVDLDVVVECSSGTYVRALARDLGAALGTGGHLTALLRTRVGPFTLAEAQPLESDDARVSTLTVQDLSSVARRCFPTRVLTADQARDVGYGRALPDVELCGGLTALLDPDGTFLALYRPEGSAAVPEAVFVG